MRLRLPRRRIWRVVIYLFSFLLILLAADLLLVQHLRGIEPGFDTTRIIEPTMPDGEIDYLTGLENDASDGVTPEKNSARLILQALGRAALDPKQPMDGITDRLGMPHLAADGDYFVNYTDYCKAHSARPQDDFAEAADLQRVFEMTAKIDPITRQWVDANQKPLDVLVEASKQPRFFMPFNGGFRYGTMAEIRLSYLKPLRDAEQALLVRSLIRLEGGHEAGFAQDLLAAHRLARLLCQSQTMIDRAVAASLEISACRTGQIAAGSGKLSATQAKSFATDLASLGDLPFIIGAMDNGERYIELDILQYMARAGPMESGRLINSVAGPHDAIFPPWVYLFVPLPYERMMHGVNHLDDAALATEELGGYPKRVAAMQLRDQEFAKKGRFGNAISGLIWGEWPVQWIVPASMVRPTQMQYKAMMENRLTQIAMNLAAYKAEHGVFPNRLEQLLPDYFREVPMDLFSEKPLIYSAHDGGYTLYSVGPNMVDDGGKNRPPLFDDLVVTGS